MNKENLIHRFWILYFAALGTGVEKFIDQLDELARKIDEGHQQCEEALIFFENSFLEIMLNDENHPDYFLN
jgi:hypothetical protein